MRLCLDVCVSQRTELELWRAGYRIPVLAQAGEPDGAWLARAAFAGCQVVVTADWQAGKKAKEFGIHVVFIKKAPNHLGAIGGGEMMRAVLDGLEELENTLAKTVDSGSNVG